jgi:hypothetical protein
MLTIIHDQKKVVAKEEADHDFKFAEARDQRDMRDQCVIMDTMCQKQDDCLRVIIIVMINN